MRQQINVRNTAIVAALIVVILIVSAFRSGMPSDGAGSPEAVVKQYRGSVEILAVKPAPHDLVGCIKYCWFDGSHPSAVVFSTEPGRSQTDAGAFSAELVGESNGVWRSLTGGGSSEGDPRTGSPPPVNLIAMKVPRSSITFRYGVRNDYMMAIGRTPSSAAVLVEVDFDDGQTGRDGLTNGVFAVFAKADAVCEVRLLDAAGSVLQRIGPDDDPLLAMHLTRNAPDGCRSSGS